jgi:hypothetical protein
VGVVAIVERLYVLVVCTWEKITWDWGTDPAFARGLMR